MSSHPTGLYYCQAICQTLVPISASDKTDIYLFVWLNDTSEKCLYDKSTVFSFVGSIYISIKCLSLHLV